MGKLVSSTFLLAFLLAVQVCAAQTQRYVYFFNDWGEGVKLDLRQDKLISFPDLKGLVPILNYNTAVSHLGLPEQQKLFVLSVLDEPLEKPVPYRLLEYRLPSMVPVSKQDLPALEQPQVLLSFDRKAVGIGSAPGGHIENLKYAFEITGSALNPVSPRPLQFPRKVSMDELNYFLSGSDKSKLAFALDSSEGKKKVSSASAGQQQDTRLYSLYAGTPFVHSSAFAVVTGYNPGRLTVVREAPYADSRDLHLSSDGRTVLVQEENTALKPGDYQRTGRIVGYSSDTGKQLFDYRIPALKETAPPHTERDIVQFLCMSPDRVAIFMKNARPIIVHGQTGRYTVIPKSLLDKNTFCTFMNQ